MSAQDDGDARPFLQFKGLLKGGEAGECGADRVGTDPDADEGRPDTTLSKRIDGMGNGRGQDSGDDRVAERRTGEPALRSRPLENRERDLRRCGGRYRR